MGYSLNLSDCAIGFFFYYFCKNLMSRLLKELKLLLLETESSMKWLERKRKRKKNSTLVISFDQWRVMRSLKWEGDNNGNWMNWLPTGLWFFSEVSERPTVTSSFYLAPVFLGSLASILSNLLTRNFSINLTRFSVLKNILGEYSLDLLSDNQSFV